MRREAIAFCIECRNPLIATEHGFQFCPYERAGQHDKLKRARRSAKPALFVVPNRFLSTEPTLRESSANISLVELALLWHSAGRPFVRVLLAKLTRGETLHENRRIEARTADNRSGIGNEAITASAAQLGAGTDPHRPSRASPAN